MIWPDLTWPDLTWPDQVIPHPCHLILLTLIVVSGAWAQPVTSDSRPRVPSGHSPSSDVTGHHLLTLWLRSASKQEWLLRFRSLGAWPNPGSVEFDWLRSASKQEWLLRFRISTRQFRLTSTALIILGLGTKGLMTRAWQIHPLLPSLPLQGLKVQLYFNQ